MQKVKKPRCPFCRKPLTPNPSYEDWYECTTQDCELMGMEGFPWHWEAIAKKIKPKTAGNGPEGE